MTADHKTVIICVAMVCVAWVVAAKWRPAAVVINSGQERIIDRPQSN